MLFASQVKHGMLQPDLIQVRVTVTEHTLTGKMNNIKYKDRQQGEDRVCKTNTSSHRKLDTDIRQHFAV